LCIQHLSLTNAGDTSNLAPLNYHECCNIILQALKCQSTPVDVNASIYTRTFFKLLDHNLCGFSSAPTARNAVLLLIQTEIPAVTISQQQVRTTLYRVLAIVATELASGGTSIETISRKIVEAWKIPLKEPFPVEVHQCVFKLVSLITMLYTAADNPIPGKFQLIVSNSGLGVRSRYQQSSTWHQLEYDITDTSIEKDLDHLLAHFGNPVLQRCYPPTETRRDLYEDMLIASNLNYHTLSKIGHLEIEWVDTLSLHLELHERSSKLRLFAFPSFCAMLCADIQSQETLLSK
jgi:hypothetical protein